MIKKTVELCAHASAGIDKYNLIHFSSGRLILKILKISLFSRGGSVGSKTPTQHTKNIMLVWNSCEIFILLEFPSHILIIMTLWISKQTKRGTDSIQQMVFYVQL